MGADNVYAIKGERMYDTGSTTFMLICTMLVFLMTPGLAFFYGACPGAKCHQHHAYVLWRHWSGWCAVDCCRLVAAYGGDGSSPLIGGLDQLLCLPVLNQVLQAAEAMPRTVPSILRLSTSPFRWHLP